MELNETPTPISEAARLHHFGGVVDISVSQDLERKLAACRTTLESITHDMGASQQIHDVCAETLELTKP